MIYGPNPDERAELNDILAGVAVERLPVQYEVSINIGQGGGASFYVKAYSALQDDAEAVAEFALRLTEAYRLAGGGE